MKIFKAIKNFINRVNDVDKKSKKMSDSNATNPFDFKFARTYAWIEKDKDANSQ